MTSLPNFDKTDSDGRKFREITLPAGTFKMFEDRPFVWTQDLQPGELNVAEKIAKADAEGLIGK